MTQPPPPPPNQPPQQGFGPPPAQPPQPGPPQPAPGYGYPQAPQPAQGAAQTPPPPLPPTGPPQPPAGYGYPQAPQPPHGSHGPQGPQPSAGYGYPGQPPAPAPGAPNPYAHPQQPGPYGAPQPQPQPQPGYGYPAQPGGPTVPMQPQAVRPGGGGGGRDNKQLLIIVSAVVAIALIVGGGIWYSKTSGDGDGKKETANSSGSAGGKGGDQGGGSAHGTEKAPADTTAKVLFQVPLPKVQDSTTVAGSWLTDKVYAKSGVAEIAGYDPDKGTKLWTVKLPGPVCRATPHTTSDGRTAILYEPAMPTKARPSHGCSQIAALDVVAGKKLWTRTVKSGDQLINFDNITIGGGTVALGGTNGGAAFDIADGTPRWAPKPADPCYDAGYAGGDKLVAVRKCGRYGNRQLHIQTLDPKSGKVNSEYKLQTGIEDASVVSTDPLVVAADVGDSAEGKGISDVFSIDNRTGALRTRISVPADRYEAKCDGISRIEGCTGIVIGNDKAYLATAEHDGSAGSYGQTNEIVAFELGTGKQTGQRADAGDGYTITPLRMDGGDVLAYKSPPYDKGSQVVGIDGGSFEQTKLLETASTDAVHDLVTSFSTSFAEILYHDGRLYMSQAYASHWTSTSERCLVLALGTG
ncbi:PQQ-binding-like beta-propeller repeat protein [Streptomyces sp. NPDC015220]|uniref:outer membrane protein assembly factor BamB family protein n=1 Tax=Streptomyces sp. NPDC015220 TaxID=3364947 RepID=UPI003702A42B